MKLLSMLFVTLLAMATSLYAVDESIAYHGALRDEMGNKLTQKSLMIEFRLYAQPMGGDFLWGRCIHVDLDDNGLFNCQLAQDVGTELKDGKYSELKDALDATRRKPLYIGLTVIDGEGNAAGEISPRQQVLAVPYSTYALDVDRASADFSVGGNLAASTAKVTGLSVSSSATLYKAEVKTDLNARGVVKASKFD